MTTVTEKENGLKWPYVKVYYDVREPISVYLFFRHAFDALSYRKVHLYDVLWNVFRITYDREEGILKKDVAAFASNRQEMYQKMVELVKKEIENEYKKKKRICVEVSTNDLELWGLLLHLETEF
ncbi:MAG: hypothetical protein QW228_07840 [Candidatus Aenigmatarchaeota archaeon]